MCVCGCGRRTIKLKNGRWLPYRGVECHPRNKKNGVVCAFDQVVGFPPPYVPKELPIKPVIIKSPSSEPQSGRMADVLAWVEKNKKVIEEQLTGREYLSRMSSNTKAAANARKRRVEDPLFRITCALRGRLRHGVKKGKKPASTFSLLGCSVDDFKVHIEGQFKSGMTWQNFGEWELDHVKPCASFDLTLPEQVFECFHWSNFQPLWKSENRQKSSRWEGVRWCRGAPIITV